MRVFMALGPGDIVGDHEKRVAGRAASRSMRGETSITFSAQAIALLHARGHEALLVSSHPRRACFSEGAIETRNVPKWRVGRGGIAFHIGQVAYAIRLAAMARRFRAQLAIIDSGTTHWFMLTAFTLMGIPVALNFHNVRWPQGFEPRGTLARFIRRLDSWFIRTRAKGAAGCSPECAIQARADGADALPVFLWTGQFSADGFEPEQPPAQDGAFHVLFAGRVERNKGVFDLVEMASMLRTRPDLKVVFDVCGDGGDLEPLRAAVKQADLADVVRVHGRLERAALLQAYARAHVVIVPTRGDFCEGMPLVCAEAMLSGRPVITSRLSNALPVIGEAIAEAQPESPPSYVAAIEMLAGDPSAWARLQAATIQCRQQFLDRSRSYPVALDRLIALVAKDSQPPLAYRHLFDED